MRETPPASLPQAIELADTPFYPQEEFQCGPAALATTLTTVGLTTFPEQLTHQLFLPARRGSLQIEMLASARRHGALAINLAPRLDAVLREVAEGRPVIVLQNLALDWAPIWHYAVVIGYDLDTETVILRSGRRRREVMEMSVFERTWARSRHWAMITIAPGTIPATVAESDYLRAAIAFETTASAEAARHNYAAAASKWPRNQLALLGLGNTAFALRDWKAAESAFRQLAEIADDPVPALNNLAFALDGQGRLEEALEAARQAVARGGPFAAQSRNTLDTLTEKARMSGR